MRKFLFSVLFAVAVLVIVFSLIISISLNQTKPNTQSSYERTLKGLSFSPKNNTEDGLKDFFEKADKCCEVLTWVGDIAELQKDSSGAAFIMKAAPENNLLPVPIFVVQESHIHTLNSIYTDLILSFIKEYDIKYIGIGNEINRELGGDDLQIFVDWFNKVSIIIHDANPDLEVFTVIQYETMKGLNGGLFGGSNDPSKSQWQLLNLFKNADFFGITTYPGLIYFDPEDIPSSYLSEIRNFTTKPLAISEIAWFKDNSTPLWESSAEEQNRFVLKIPELINGTDSLVKFAVWPFLYDLIDPIPPFTTMGLMNSDEETSNSYDSWVKLEF